MKFIAAMFKRGQCAKQHGRFIRNRIATGQKAKVYMYTSDVTLIS